MISGINHITLAVRDIEQSFAFYRTVLGCQPIAKWPRGAYLLAGDVWLALVVDDQARATMLPEYTHIAFSVAAAQFAALAQAIRRSDAPLWQENWTEGDSLYFCDPNGHKLEIHASDLATRLSTARAQPWEGLEFFVKADDEQDVPKLSER
jgi:catechol 2,3-dioxygenase-like lactoylglutathione lyase family enzyme